MHTALFKTNKKVFVQNGALICITMHCKSDPKLKNKKHFPDVEFTLEKDENTSLQLENSPF